MRLQSFFAFATAAIGFVAGRNVLDTPDQRRLDALAVKIFQKRPFDDLIAETRKAFLETTEQYGYQVTGNPIQEQRLDTAMEEFAFSCLQRIVNDDPARPTVYWLDTAPRPGIFGGRFGYDNTDNTYRTIPVNSSYSYIIRGKRTQVADATFTLHEDWVLTPSTSTLTKEQLVIEADGSYTITVNSSASDSPNHIQIFPKSRLLMLRFNMGDWIAEAPDQVEVRVVEQTVPPTKPLTDEEIIKRAREEIRISIPTYSQLIQGDWTLSQPQNVIIPPFQDPDAGILPTQATSFSHFNMSKSEAIVITIDAAGAPYWNLVSHTLYQITFDPQNRTESLNMEQVVLNKNGTTTMVLSSTDAGVHNWLKAMDEGQGVVLTRFQGLRMSNEDAGARISVWSQVVPLTQLHKVLPPETKYVTKPQRPDQLKKRAQGWDHIRKF